MILSHDHKSLFLSVPKTGSTTMRELLKPYGILINRGHGNRFDFEDVYREQFPDSNINLADITSYVFWRDPVERFLSATTFSLQFKRGVCTFFPEYFSEGTEYMNDTFNSMPERFDHADFDRLPEKTKQKLHTLVMDDEIVLRVLQCAEYDNLVFRPQYHWHTHENTVTLNFHDYENEARRLLTIFGADSSVEIPKRNEKPDFFPKLNITEHYASAVLHHYFRDIALNPRFPREEVT